jgi:hypothetical protein
MRDGLYLITRQSPVQIPSPQLVLTVAKSGYRRVIRKADAERRRPFCVLPPVLATSSRAAAWLGSEISASRATRGLPVFGDSQGQSRPKLSAVSLSRAARVIEGCERSYRAQLALFGLSVGAKTKGIADGRTPQPQRYGILFQPDSTRSPRRSVLPVSSHARWVPISTSRNAE